MKKYVLIIAMLLTHYSWSTDYRENNRKKVYSLIVDHSLVATGEDRTKLGAALYYLQGRSRNPHVPLKPSAPVLRTLQQYELASQRGRVYPGTRETAQDLTCLVFGTGRREHRAYYLLDR